MDGTPCDESYIAWLKHEIANREDETNARMSLRPAF
jgi:hypothetical protein